MKINQKKTQLLCVHDNKFNRITSYIRTDGNEIVSGNSLKILGFNFNSCPTATHHVSGVIEKFYGKLWTLRFLKRSGMPCDELLAIFKNVIRPSVEYSSIIYHSLIPDYISDRLESVQKQAMKIIYGHNIDYAGLVDNSVIEPLNKRRIDNAVRFALKAAASPRFGPVWFKEHQDSEREVRATTRAKYVEKFCRTERSRNNPLNYLTRLLNEHLSK